MPSIDAISGLAISGHGSAVVPISCTFQKTDASDTLNADATVAVVATLQQTDANDLVDAETDVAVVAAFTETDADDALDAQGTVTDPFVSCVFQQTDAADTLDAEVDVAVVASFTQTDAADTLDAEADVPVAASFVETDENDTLNADATVTTPPISCSFVQTDAHDSLDAAAAVSVVVVFSETDENDTLYAYAVGKDIECSLVQVDDDDGKYFGCRVRTNFAGDSPPVHKYTPTVKGPVFQQVMRMFKQGQLRRDITKGPPVTSEREARIIAYLAERDQEMQKKAAVEGTNWSENPFTMQKV